MTGSGIDHSASVLPFREVLVAAIQAWNTIKVNRAVLVAGAVVGLVIGAFVAFGSTKEYQSQAKLLPYRIGATSGLSGIAGLAGIRLPAAGEQQVSADLYPEIVATVDFRAALANIPLRFSGENSRTKSFKGYFSESYSPSPVEVVWSFTGGLPRRISSAMAGLMAPSSGGAVTPADGLQRYSLADLEVYEELQRRLQVSVDRKSGLVTVRSTMPDPLAAADLAGRTIELLMRKVTDIEAGKASEQLRFVLGQQTAALSRVEAEQAVLARFLTANRGALDPVLSVQEQRLRTNVALATALYEQLSREVEQAKLRESQDTPAFSVLQQPAVPPKKFRPRRLLAIVASSLGFALLALAFTTLSKSSRQLVGL